MTPSRVGVLGGTFDPIHLGHIGLAKAAEAALSLDRILFIPDNHPPHRRSQPRASGYHRFAMVALAIEAYPRWTTSDMELTASEPSYTSATLRRLHATGLRASQLFVVLGADAFAEIETWKEYPTLLALARFVVISRPGYRLSQVRERLPRLADRMIHLTGGAPTGSDTKTILLVDAATPDVSATTIRERAASGQSLEGLVPGEVAQYIERQGLYRS